MKVEDIELSLGFEEVAIKQGLNICKSRSDVNIESEVIRGVRLKVPLISANMSSVTNPYFALKMAQCGGLGVLHRALLDDDRVDQVKELVGKTLWVATSIGVGDNEFEMAKRLIEAGATIIVIDIAHGFSKTVFNQCSMLKKNFSNIKVVMGNVTDPDVMSYADEVDADGVKVGIGQGLGCSTKDTAGATERQFSAVLKFKELSKKYGLPVISDGGIRIPSDFTKAISAGANSIMAGSIFSRCSESAADLEYIDGVPKKIYFGMASRKSQEQWHGKVHNSCPEGKVVYLDLGEGVENLMQRYAGALRSGISYAGGNDIKSFQEKVKFVRFK